MLRKHVRLNYSFTRNHQDNIDSARVGNETRYINHGSDDKKANSIARSALRPEKLQHIPTDFLIQQLSYMASLASHYIPVSRVEAVQSVIMKDLLEYDHS